MHLHERWKDWTPISFIFSHSNRARKSSLSCSSPEKRKRMGKIQRGDWIILEELSIPPRIYSLCYFQHLQLVQNMVPKCQSTSETKFYCMKTRKPAISVKIKVTEKPSVEKLTKQRSIQNFGIHSSDEFFVPLQTPVKWFITWSRTHVVLQLKTDSIPPKLINPPFSSKTRSPKKNPQRKSMRRRETNGAEIQRNLRNPERSREPCNPKFELTTPAKRSWIWVPDSHPSTADKKSYCTKFHNPPFSSNIKVKK